MISFWYTYLIRGGIIAAIRGDLMGRDKGYVPDFHEEGYTTPEGTYSAEDDFMDLMGEEFIADLDTVEGERGAQHRKERGLRDETGQEVEIDPDEDLT